jgi:hypothetical protein
MKTYAELMNEGATVQKHHDEEKARQTTIRQDREKAAADAAHHTTSIVDKVKSTIKEVAGGGKYRKEGSDHILKFDGAHHHKVSKQLATQFSKRIGGIGFHHQHHDISVRNSKEHGYHVHISPPTADKLMPRGSGSANPSSPFKHGLMRRS